MILHKYVKKGLKITGWIVVSIIGLLLLVVLLIQIPAVQEALKEKAIAYLEGKIRTPVSIGKIEIGLPKKVILEDVYFQSQSGDTLLAGEKIAVDISLFKLFDDEVEINSISLKNITANVKRDKDSVFNFDYIIDAFASKETKSTGKPTTFSVHNINLDNIKVRFDDAITKNNLKVTLGHFETKMKVFDLDQMSFEIAKIQLDGLNVKLKQGELIREITTNTIVKTDSILRKRPDLKIKLGEIALSKINVSYDSDGTHLNSGVSLDKLFISFTETNIPKQRIAINKFELEGVKGGLTFGKYDRDLNIKTPAQNLPDWTVTLADASMKQIDFRFDDENSLREKRGIDYKHLNIKQLQLQANNLKWTNVAITGNIKSFAVKEQSGVDIKALRTDFVYSAKGVQLKKLYLETPKTLIRNEVVVNYPSIETLRENPGLLGLKANLQNSRIAFTDILLFAPELNEVSFFKNNPKAIAQINGQITGQLRDLTFPQMQISNIGNMSIIASGRIIGLPDGQKAWYNLDVKKLELSAQDFANVLGSELIPSNIQLPKQMTVRGTFKGKLDNFYTDVIVNSSYGEAKIKTTFDYRLKDKERYNGVAQLNNFDIGQLIKNNAIGKVSLKAKVNGTGLNPKTATANIDGLMTKGFFNGYTYQNLAVKGTIVKGQYKGTAISNDPNLEFDLVTEGSFKDKYPQTKVKLNVDIADLEKLNLHAGPFKLKGQVDADLSTAHPDYLNGKIAIHHLLFANGKENFQLDSINITAVATAEKTAIQVKSQLLKATIEGKYQLSQIATAISNSVAKYYNLDPTVKRKATSPQRFDFTLDINNDPVISKLFPDVTQLQPISINGRYNSVNDTIVLKAIMPKLVYGSTIINNAVININTKENALTYNVFIDEVQNAQFRLPSTAVEGIVKDNTLGYSFLLLDDKNKDQYRISGSLKAIKGNTEIRLSPEDLLLNYEKWTLADNNLISLGKHGIYANDFELQNGDTRVKLQSLSNVLNAPLSIDFTDFDIATLSRMVQKEALAFGGLINGKVVFENLATQANFTSDLTIGNFTYKKEAIGDISLSVHNRVANTYDVKAAISGQGNQLALAGIYRNGDQSFDLNLDMQHLNLLSIQPFTADQISKSSGYISGKFHIKGTFEQPRIIGDLQFHNGAFTVKTLNSAFELLNDSMSFTEEGMVFKKFNFADSEKNTLDLKGNIDTPNYRDYAFNLRVNADNFKVTNSTAKDNDLYYGKLYVDSRLRINGDLNKPIVDGSIKVNKNTELSIVLPQSDPAIADREGIVEFVDQDAPPIDERFLIAVDSLNQSKFKGMNISVNIEVNKEAELTLVIDKGNGDYLKLKGEAQLNGSIDESGKTSLTGRYELQEGSYEMTFNFLKRKFEIQRGSYILWTGEPTTADINIKAVYKTKTAPIDLLDNQLGDISPTVRNTYKQRIPFETVLKMTGELLKPTITFDIILPEGNYNVSSEIVNTTRTKLEQLRQQPDEMNKQVFALLLLNRFIGENPFASEAGTGTETFARQSVSKILSQQLNNLAGDLIKGVELDLDLESSDDYTTGEKANRTDLSVGVSKELLDDRLKVSVGSSFGIEGPEQANRDATNIAGDVSLDYKLSKDGRYTLRAYRKNEYQVALQGQVIETGVAFIITMDYNKLSELFHRSEEEKEVKRLLKRKEKEEKLIEKEKAEQPITPE